MSDHDALLAGVLANPDADLPRLVYADFIEEAGDAARAEFIRVQCAQAAGQYEDDNWKAALELRERYLREKHGPEWLAPLKAKGEPLFTPRSHGLFRRGFVECVWMPAAWFVAKAEKLFARCPVNELRVTMGARGDYAGLFQSARFGELQVLDIADRRFSDEGISELNQVRLIGRLQNLKRLRLRSCNFDCEYAYDVIIGWPSIDFAPTELDLSGNPFTRTQIEWLRWRYGAALLCNEPT